MLRARPLSEGEWEKRYRKLYGKPPSGTEFAQFMRNMPKASFSEAEAEDGTGNDEP